MRYPRNELARMCSDSFLDCWAMAYSGSPRKVLWREPDMILFSTGAQSSYQNGVLKARLTSSNMAVRVNKALRFFKERRLPMIWFVDPWSTPAGLGEYLRRRGLTPDWEIPCLAIDLSTVIRKPLPRGLEIRPVEDLESLDVCLTAADRGFDTGKRIRNDRWRETYAGIGIGSTKRWFTGFLRGKPVASSLLLLQNGLATVWIVATLKRARGHGIGTAMTYASLLLAKSLGYDVAIIQASKMGLPVYQKIGFKEYCKIRTYVWKPK